MPPTRSRFRGHIAGLGSTSGIRVVVGHWPDTPLGPFSDAMVETAAGHRVLLAPRPEVRDFIAATYSFDEIRLEPVEVTVAGQVWSFRSDVARRRLHRGPAYGARCRAAVRPGPRRRQPGLVHGHRPDRPGGDGRGPDPRDGGQRPP